MISFKRGFLWIVFSILIFSGIPWAFFAGNLYLFSLKKADPQYHIVEIIQEGGELKTDFLAELMDLSNDRPINLYQFDVHGAKEKLERFPLIKKARIKKIPPHTLHIQYETRKPFALLGCRANTAIDSEGVLFPFYPFFSEESLPTIAIGTDDLKWGMKILEEQLTVCQEILALLHPLKNLTIDISRAASPSLGEQRIVVTTEKHSVILDPLSFSSGLRRYQRLLSSKKFKIISGSVMIDLRLQDLGFLEVRNG